VTAPARIWRAGSKTIALSRPVVVGIVNVTPDSFSDGGRFFSADDAVTHGRRLVDDGADILDIGGESTRPGAQNVSAEEELRRVIPVIEGVRRVLPDVPLSIDTVKATVAAEALAAGADIVNDVSALRLDAEMTELCARARCGVILMHSRGTVGEMATYVHATYGSDITGEVSAELAERAVAAERSGIARDAIVLDPGFGFSKRTEHSLTILRELPRLVDQGYPVLVGLSRKRLIGELTGVTDADQRDAATTGANVYGFLRGARLFRVHEVSLARQALDVAWKLACSNGSDEM
jgi:dihydropteroate synthase